MKHVSANSSAGTKEFKIWTLFFQHVEVAEHDLEVLHFEFKFSHFNLVMEIAKFFDIR